MGVRELHLHEAACRREHVKRGDRFLTLVPTYVGGRNGKRVRRPVQVEVLKPHGETGFMVKNLATENIFAVKHPRRFLEWPHFEPGLTRTRGAYQRLAATKEENAQ